VLVGGLGWGGDARSSGWTKRSTVWEFFEQPELVVCCAPVSSRYGDDVDT